MSARIESMRGHAAATRLLLVCLLTTHTTSGEMMQMQRTRVTPMYIGIGTDGSTPKMDLGFTTHSDKFHLAPVQTTMHHSMGVQPGFVMPHYDDIREAKSFFNNDHIRPGLTAGSSLTPADAHVKDKKLDEIKHKSIMPKSVHAGDVSMVNYNSITSQANLTGDGEVLDASLDADAKSVSTMPGETTGVLDNSDMEMKDAKPVTAARVHVRNSATANAKGSSHAKATDKIKDAVPDSEIENTLAETHFRQMFPVSIAKDQKFSLSTAKGSANPPGSLSSEFKNFQKHKPSNYIYSDIL